MGMNALPTYVTRGRVSVNLGTLIAARILFAIPSRAASSPVRGSYADRATSATVWARAASTKIARQSATTRPLKTGRGATTAIRKHLTTPAIQASAAEFPCPSTVVLPPRVGFVTPVTPMAPTSMGSGRRQGKVLLVLSRSVPPMTHACLALMACASVANCTASTGSAGLCANQTPISTAEASTTVDSPTANVPATASAPPNACASTAIRAITVTSRPCVINNHGASWAPESKVAPALFGASPDYS